MRLFYVSHSCYVIESSDSVIAFDPWITSSAYHRQWHLYPRPVDTSLVTNADAILISHGHEDHLNQESLELIQKKAHVFFPFQWRNGVVGYLNHLGFGEITEALSFHTYQFRNVTITYLGYSLESVIVVECDGNVIVNINDALNSNHETAVEYLLKEIKTRWGKIDYLLSGWSGAGYFPNKVNFKGKDNLEVARIREQYFANNFCRFTQYLQPEIALAFAPGFVLLDDENRWINEIKFPREILDMYYRENFDNETSIRFPIAFPGDYFDEKKFFKVSSFHGRKEKEIYKDLDSVFSEEIAEANRIEWFDEDAFPDLIAKLKFWLIKNKSIYHPTAVADAVFSIRLKDVTQKSYLQIRFVDGIPEIKRAGAPCTDDRLMIETKASLLALNLEKEWGGDLLTIGYGINVTVHDELSLEKNLDIVCVRLISRFPIFKDDFMRNSGRILKYYLTNPSISNLWLKQKVKLRPYVNKYPFNERDHWLTYNKCEICKVCNMQEVNFEELDQQV